MIISLYCFTPGSVIAQQPGTLSGTVRDHNGQPVPKVTILLKGAKRGTTADEKGHYQFTGLPGEKITLQINAVGYAPFSIVVTPGTLQQDLVLRPHTQHIKEVNVEAMSETRKAARQAYQVTAIDAVKLHNTTLDIAHALSYVPGVRVRESGGLGSNIDFSLNGFSGNQVKFFIDGIPMDNFGSSFGINNIPINLAERIEVYKGAVPVTLGADALGGAVNIVTNSQRTNYLDASYSFGSFNTHKSSVNFGLHTKSGFVLQVNAYQNYSDNNYWIESETPVDRFGTVEKVRARRFHDRYHNEMLILGVGVRKKKWADQLMLGVNLGKSESQLQNGATMEDVYGQRLAKGNILIPSLKYIKKDLGLKGLSLTVNANYNLGNEQTIDTVFKEYNWLGEVVKDHTANDPTRKGGERSRMNYRYKDNNGMFSGNLSYRINDHHSVVLNNTYTTFRRTGEDLLNESDVYLERPRTVRKNVIGLAYRFDYSDKWNITAFAKNYRQFSRSFLNVKGKDNPQREDYDWRENSFSATGYGMASTYFLKSDLQLRASYEHGIRVPGSSELFGNVNTLTGNIDLKPESSENINLGVIYSPTFNKVHRLIIDAGILYRYSKDFIRPSLAKGSAYTIQQMVNLRDVDNKGVEASVQYAYKNKLRVGANFSYQHLINQTKYEDGKAASGVSLVYKDRLPNIPYMFGNADASYTFHQLFGKKDFLTLNYTLQYVHAYFEGWPSLGEEETKITIPTQWNHGASLLYSFGGGKYNVNFECLNLTDALLYDHFKLQKASRAFNIKLRYFLFHQK
nr:TonB-dependent receptor [Chitinophaga nivalis]